MRTGTGKRKPIKRYASGGTYQPLGLPTDPAEIRAQKAELHKTDNMNFTEGLGKFATNVLLPMAMTALGGPGGAAMGSALSKGIGSLGARSPITPAPVGELNTPTIDYVDPSIGSAQQGVANVATGGDLPLSSSSFQVKGNPQVTDGNYYPQLNAKLDHNEVISTTANGGKFVFSDILKEGDRSFAAHAKEYEAAKGKAEKRLKANPNDEQSKSTISQTNGLLEALANRQEMLAASKGLRNPDGSTVQQAAYGGKLAAHTPMTVHNWQYTRPPVKTIRLATGGPGPIDPPKYMEVDTKYNIYYDPYNDMFLERLPDGRYVPPSNDFSAGNHQGEFKKPDASVIKQHLMLYPQQSQPTTLAPKAQQRVKNDTAFNLNPMDPRGSMTGVKTSTNAAPPIKTLGQVLDDQLT